MAQAIPDCIVDTNTRGIDRLYACHEIVVCGVGGPAFNAARRMTAEFGEIALGSRYGCGWEKFDTRRSPMQDGE